MRAPKRITNSCEGDWVNMENWKPNNYGLGSGSISTPMQFTRNSINSGYIAMATQLDLCDIAKVVKKMGVTSGNGQDIKMATANSVIGDAAVSPIAMAGAYATVANNGIYCQPTAIDRVTDSDGNELPKPERSCSQVLDPKIAATTAYALQGVMNGGTGNNANPRDGVPVLGKTGTHETYQTWMVESSTKVATAVWVGNSIGETNVSRTWVNGQTVNNLRYPIARAIQAAANSVYGGDRFADADSNLMRQVLVELPSVVGKGIDDARQTLVNAGFEVVVGDPVDSAEAEGIIAAQNPAAGRVAGGTTVTINPSNAQGTSVPDVTGQPLDKAVSDLRGAGFGSVTPGTCTADASADGGPRVTSTSPSAGSAVNRNTAISVNYSARDCD